MITGLAEIVREMVLAEAKKGLRLQAGAAAGLAVAVTPAEPGEWARLVLSRAGRAPAAAEEATAVLGVFQALDRRQEGLARPLRVQRGVTLIGGHVATIVEWQLPVKYEARPGVVESQVPEARVVTADPHQVALFPLPRRHTYVRG